MFPIPSKVGVNVTVLAKEELVVESVVPSVVHLVHELVGKNERHFHGSQFVSIVLVTDIDEVRLHWQPWSHQVSNAPVSVCFMHHPCKTLSMLRHVPVSVSIVLGALPCNLRDCRRRQDCLGVHFEKLCLKMPPMWLLQLVLDHSLRLIKLNRSREACSNAEIIAFRPM